MNDEYWANLPSDELPAELSKKVNNYYDYCSRYGILDRWKRAYTAYYGMSDSGSDTTHLGQAQNGELYILKVNHFRSLLQNLLVLITQQPPAVQPKATNTDSKSMNETILAKGVIDYYMREKKAKDYFKEAAEFSLFGGEGFVTLTWDTGMGEAKGIDPSSGRPYYDGDVVFKSFHPIDMIREVYTDSNAPKYWHIVRDFENKYDLAAKFPAFAKEIISINKSPDFMSQYHYIAFEMASSDDIPTYTFYHEPTDSVPNGRLMKYIRNDLWLIDTALPYKHVPVYGMKPAKWHGTPFGYTVAYDLMGIQRNVDALQSVIATNQMNYGVQNIVTWRGSEVDVVSLSQGLNNIIVNPGSPAPQALNLVQTPSEIFNQINNLVKEMETLSGINSTARGNPEESLKSGTALALVAAQAIQFNSGLQDSYNDLIQNSITGLVEILQRFASTPRMIDIVGKSNRSHMKEFKGDDLSNISRVVCESVNPLSKTAAGRLQMADNLLQMPGMIKTPQHYFEVIETGVFDPMVEHQTSQIVYIRSENEELSEGKAVHAILTEDHLLHVREHSSVLDSIETRSDPKILNQVLAHINEHLGIFENPANYKFLICLGQNPPPPAPPPGMQAPPPEPMPHHPPSAPSQHAFPVNTGNPANLSPVPPQAIAATQHLRRPTLPHLPQGTPPGLESSYEQLKGNLTS